MSTISLVTYNVNGIRAAIKKGWIDWVGANQFDVICVQETKANKEQVELDDLREMGYEDHWFSAQKKGYSGVAIFTKLKADHIEYGMGHELFDFEGRVIRMDYKDVSFISVYFPSGSAGDIRQDVKFEFLDAFFPYIQKLRKKRKKIIISGDYNICHLDIDIHNPTKQHNTSGFLPEERAWMDKLFDSKYIDVFRHFNMSPDIYSWWSYRAGARKNNKGWRLDYHTATDSLKDQLVNAEILTHVIHSDHCPVLMKFKM
ncbi:UNVERIFIED_CONTAM: hypothetical protein GTU68_058049 [Idotea baltica]|nr:hypothetical protein [Idotea baltica]